MSDLSPPPNPSIDALMSALAGGLLGVLVWPLLKIEAEATFTALMAAGGVAGGLMLGYGLSRETPASARVFGLPTLWMAGVWAGVLARPLNHVAAQSFAPMVGLSALGMVTALTLARRQRPERKHQALVLLSHAALGAALAAGAAEHAARRPALVTALVAVACFIVIDRRTRWTEVHILARLSVVGVIALLPVLTR